MSSEFQTLCNLLDDELERQETVNAVCLAQHEALCARDAQAIAARNEALELLGRESRADAAARAETVATLAKTLELKPGETRLRDLAGRAPEPWKSKLTERRASLRNAVEDNRRLLKRNALIASKSKAVAESWRETLFRGLQQSGPAYRGDGMSSAAINDAPAMIDRKG